MEQLGLGGVEAGLSLGVKRLREDEIALEVGSTRTLAQFVNCYGGEVGERLDERQVSRVIEVGVYSAVEDERTEALSLDTKRSQQRA